MESPSESQPITIKFSQNPNITMSGFYLGIPIWRGVVSTLKSLHKQKWILHWNSAMNNNKFSSADRIGFSLRIPAWMRADSSPQNHRTNRSEFSLKILAWENEFSFKILSFTSVISLHFSLSLQFVISLHGKMSSFAISLQFSLSLLLYIKV